MAEKHEIYAAAFSGHLFYDLFLRAGGGGCLDPLLSWYLSQQYKTSYTKKKSHQIFYSLSRMNIKMFYTLTVGLESVKSSVNCAQRCTKIKILGQPNSLTPNNQSRVNGGKTYLFLAQFVGRSRLFTKQHLGRLFLRTEALDLDTGM